MAFKWLRQLVEPRRISRREERPSLRKHRFRPFLEGLEDRLAPATVSWIADADGFWDVGGNWSTGSSPGSGDDVVINRPAGSFTITHRSGTSTINSLNSSERVALTGGSLTVAGAAQISDHMTLQGGALRGAVVTATGGARLILTGFAGTLDDVTLNGDLDLPTNNARATILNGLILNGTANFSASTTRLDFMGTQTLGGAGTVIFGNVLASSLRLVNSGTTLTIGPGITVRGGSNQNFVATIGYSDWWGPPTDVSVVNQGTIVADVAAMRITVLAQSFNNQGSVEARNGGTLGLTNSWNNAGTISINNGTLDLGGTFTPTALGTINRTGGTINLTGTLNNSALLLDAAMGSWNLVGGTIRGGTVTTSGGSRLVLTGFAGALDGVTLNGDLDLPTNGARATILNGLTLNGIANFTGSTTRLDFAGTQTLGGTGTVTFGNVLAPALRLVNSGTTLTIAAGITVRGGSNQNFIATIGYSDWWGPPTDVTVINQGRISADEPGMRISVLAQTINNQGVLEARNGGHLTLLNLMAHTGTASALAGSTLSLSGNWTNMGTVVVSNGILNLGGIFTPAALGTISRSGGTINLTGTLNNTATTLLLDAPMGSWNLVGGTIRGGTLTASGGSRLILTGSGGTLDGVTLNGDLDLIANAAWATVVNGLVLNGTATLGGMGSRLDLAGTQTLGGTGTVVFGSAQGTTLRLINAGTTMTIAPGITVRGGSTFASGARLGYHESFSGPTDVSIVNQGTILADGPAGTTILVQGQSFTNRGTVEARNGGHLNLSNLTLQSSTASAVTGGTLTLGGNWSNTGTITVNNGTLNLGGNLTLGVLGTINRSGGMVNLTGTLNNASTTLHLDAVTGSWGLAGGTIRSGTVTATAGSKLILTDRGGTLDGVTVNSDVDVSAVAARATVMNGLVLNGTATISGTDSRLEFAGTQTLAGMGVMVFGNAQNTAVRLVNAATTLTMGPGITLRGGSGTVNGGHLGYSESFGGPTDVSVVNQGTIVADGPDGTAIIVRGQSFTNHGILASRNNGTLDINLPLSTNGSAVFDVQESGIVTVSSNLLGDTRNADLYRPAGLIRFDGAGTPAAPQLLEAMSRTLGSATAGFDDNFAYGRLALVNNTYVRLVDQSDNALGVGAEAIYVHSLVVPAGTTLDLNGLSIFVRAAQIAGTITGGSITQVADSGPIGFGIPTPGALAVAGELDEWRFFGRGGRSFAVVVNPGGGFPAPLPPFLNHVEVRLLDAAGTVLASASGSGSVVTLPGVVLPADGTYRIHVRAPSSQPGSTGNYVITVWDATPNEATLTLNQPVVGRIETPFRVDRWTFAAVAGQIVRFDLLSPGSLGVAFDLNGPTGWSGFTGLTADSDLLTLPSTGSYVLTARGLNGQHGMAYSFRVIETLITNLPLGTTYNGTFTGRGQAQLFRVDVPEGRPMRVVLDDSSANNHNELYVRYGTPPTRSNALVQLPLASPATFGGYYDLVANYDHRFSNPGAADQQVLVPTATPGSWYVLVYSDYVPQPSSFTLSATTAGLVLEQVTPDHHTNSVSAMLTLTGAGFDRTTTVALVAGGGASFPATTVEIDSFTRLTATFAAGAVPPGLYSVRLTQPDGDTAQLSGAFRVTSGGQANLTTNLIVPDSVGRHAPGTIYVEYANTGDAAMPAPLLVLHGSDRALMSLNEFRLAEGFWTSATPAGFGDTIQILASGRTPGVLAPGESSRVPVFFAGLQQPWNFSDTQVDFNLSVLRADDTTPINWAPLRDSLRPTFISAEAWAPIWNNFVAQAGSTGGGLVSLLNDNAAYLGRLGRSVLDVGALLAFELQQANGLAPLSTLASAVDAQVRAPGLTLELGRSFGADIARRHEVGPLGRGWSHNWQIALQRATDGTVTITGPSGSRRVFQPDRRGGAYFAQTGDRGTLTAAGSIFTLREVNDLVTRFRADGSLDFLEDPNGNRITAGYMSGRLTNLTHSSGQSLQIVYNAAGRIERVTDSAGRVTNYTYDVANEHLLTVVSDGLTTRYVYSSGAGAAREHALLSIEYPDLTHEVFTYDTRGRLETIARDGNAERVTLAYNSAGRVSATDALNNTTRYFFDHHGLLAKVEDALNRPTHFNYDRTFNLTRVTDTLGQDHVYLYDGRGNLVRSTNALGQTTAFSYAGPFNHLASVTDARGNALQYGYDSRGNLTSITYEDGSVERFAADPRGSPDSWTNRRGQLIDYTFNNGRLERKLLPDGSTVEYLYNARGNLEMTVDRTVTTVLEYLDPVDPDLVTKIRYPSDRFLQYTYVNGRRTRMVDQDSFTVNYLYDPAGRLEFLRDGGNNLIVQYRYDDAGRLERRNNGNGTFTEYQYDAAGQLEHLINRAPGGAVNSRFDYVYDSLGRRIRMTTLDGQWTYTYDAIGQLTRAVFVTSNPIQVPNQDLQYVYDAAGNRVRTILNGVTTNYTTNDLNQYTSVGAAAYRYDADGNLISVTDGASVSAYSYDPENRLVGVVTPGGTWAYEYDAFGNRFATVQNGARTEYLIDPAGLGNVVGEYGATGSLLARYTHGLGLVYRINAIDLAAYYAFDGIGSTSELTNSVGAVVNRYVFDPFGISLFKNESLSNPYQFIGRLGVRDIGANSIFMRAREYDQRSGRFIQPDPLGVRGGINTYSYAAGDPVNRTDPRGLYTPNVFDLIVRFGNWGGPHWSGGQWVNEGGLGNRDVEATDWVDAWWRYHDTQLIDNPEWATERTIAGSLVELAIRDALHIPVSLEQRTAVLAFALFGFPRTMTLDPFAPNSALCLWNPLLCRAICELFPDLCRLLTGGQTQTAGSLDPNEKTGPAGFGSIGFVARDSVLPYRIDFENEASATASAQRVVITDQLDSDLDWNTFALTEIQFGDRIIAIPAGSRYYQTTESVTVNGRTFLLQIEAGIRPESGVVYAIFQSLNPATGLPPDVLTGFLPPEDGTGRGQGHVSYVIRPRADRPTGTEIRNVALITFDANPSIATNQVDPHDPSLGTDPNKEARNTLDAGAPSSSVTALPANTFGTHFLVRWSGQDDAGGSGVASYDVYVSDNGGPFMIWQRNTSLTQAVFIGQLGRNYAFYTVARDNVGNTEAAPASPDTQTMLAPGTLRVVAADATPTGLIVQFNFALDSSTLNLYDTQTAALGPADVTLTGVTTGAIRGSLLVNATQGAVTFLRTGDVLLPDTYTVNLRSTANGFKSAGGALLDGNADGAPGDAFTTNFTLGASTAVTVSIPDFTRSPGQTVTLPATSAAAGIPLRLSNGSGITSIELTLSYDPALLDVTGAMLGTGLPANSTLSLNDLMPGRALLTFASPTPLPAGPVDFVRLTALVPNSAPYAAKHLLDLGDLRVNGGAIAARDDDGIHVAAYFGDTSGNASYSAADATRALRVAVGLDTGFSAYQLADPVIISDITTNGVLNSTDGTRILQEAVGLDQALIPPLPGVIPPIIPGGPDPLLSFPTSFRGAPGKRVTVPLNLDLSDGLENADLAISYDPTRLEVVDVRRGSLTAAFDLFAVNLDAQGGTVRVGLARSVGPIFGRGSGSVAEITFQVRKGARPGPTILNLRQGIDQLTTQLNEGGLDLIPDPSDEAGDLLDGLITILAHSKIPLEPDSSGTHKELLGGTGLVALLNRRQALPSGVPAETASHSRPAAWLLEQVFLRDDIREGGWIAPDLLDLWLERGVLGDLLSPGGPGWQLGETWGFPDGMGTWMSTSR